MSEKTKKVQLSKPMTWSGVNYAPGLNEMPAAAADYAVRKNFGKTDKGSASVSEDFEPLSLEETMKRFSEGDPSDEVFESLKFHQAKISEGMKPPPINNAEKVDGGAVDEKTDKEVGANADETEKAKAVTENKNEGSAELPEDFPMRHVFSKLGFKSVEEVQAKSREELIALNGIAETTADKALAYGK